MKLARSMIHNSTLEYLASILDLRISSWARQSGNQHTDQSLLSLCFISCSQHQSCMVRPSKILCSFAIKTRAHFSEPQDWWQQIGKGCKCKEWAEKSIHPMRALHQVFSHVVSTDAPHRQDAEAENTNLDVIINKPMPRVFITIARPSYLGSWQPDCDTGFRLVGARPKPGFLLRYLVESLLFVQSHCNGANAFYECHEALFCYFCKPCNVQIGTLMIWVIIVNSCHCWQERGREIFWFLCL